MYTTHRQVIERRLGGVQGVTEAQPPQAVLPSFDPFRIEQIGDWRKALVPFRLGRAAIGGVIKRGLLQGLEIRGAKQPKLVQSALFSLVLSVTDHYAAGFSKVC